MVEDQPLGLFPRSSRSLARWCPVSRGKPHSLTFHGSASTVRQLLLPLFQDLDFCHLGFPPISISKKASHNLPWRPPCLRHPHPLPPSSPCTPQRCQGCQELMSAHLSTRGSSPRMCRASGCSSPPNANCSVGFCSTHCTSRRCQRRSPSPVQPRCRRPDCPGTCSTKLSSEILQLALHQSPLRGA